MKLSDFNHISNHPRQIKPIFLTWDMLFVCFILLIASSSFIYDSYQETNQNQTIKTKLINIK